MTSSRPLPVEEAHTKYLASRKRRLGTALDSHRIHLKEFKAGHGESEY
jgi:hypothetical protein